MKRKIITFIMSGFAVLAASGQGSDYNFPRGYLTTQQDFGIITALSMSQYNTAFSTARSTAMGGAFTSLGGDLASMHLNPAGLGMYRSSEVGITAGLTINKMNSRFDGIDNQTNSRTTMTLNNVGAAFNLYEGYGALTSFTMGVSYNKLADFNYVSATAINGTSTSLLDVFAGQLNNNGVKKRWMDSSNRWNGEDLYIREWGATLAYHNYLIDPYNDNDPENILYSINALAGNASINHYVKTKSRGYIGEYNIAGGLNFNNIVYFGFSVGLMDIYQKQTVYYDELYSNNYDDGASAMYYDQTTKLSGTGVNFKFGVTVRPIDGLRIGAAVHTPTFVSVDKEYHAYMESHWNNSDRYNWISTNVDFYDYNFNTPTRFLAGISYTFGNYAVLAADYERTWYNGMRLTDASHYEKESFKYAAKNNFKAGNTFRAGLEVKPVPQFSLRGGYTYQGSILHKDFNVQTEGFDSPVAYKTYTISGGLGYRFSDRVYADLTYLYMNSNYTKYNLYDFADFNGEDYYISNLSQKSDRHNVMLTLGFRF